MGMRAYDEDYLGTAQRVMGDMMDFAVNSYGFDADEFFGMFLVSDVAAQVEHGNPTYVAGMTGCELAKEVIRQSGLVREELPDEMYLDKSPEYWAGWALAFYQWYTAKSFMRIHRAVPAGEILRMYPVFHEMDIMRFVEAMEEKLKKYYTMTHLKRLRLNQGMTQRELAEASGVPLRQIQLFEQKQRDINRAQALCVAKLGRALGCSSEALLEI